jgi:hypothetical protein
MNLDHIERKFELSSRKIFKSLGVIQDLLKNEKPKKVYRKKKVSEGNRDLNCEECINKSECIDKSEYIRIERTKEEIERDIYPERIVYEKTPTKPRKKKKKIGFSYSTFVVDTSSSSED